MKLICSATLLFAALLTFACGGGGDDGGSSSDNEANPTLQALVDQAEQTPVEDYEREYARQLCGPIGTYFEAAGEMLKELEDQPTPENLDDFNFDALGEVLGSLVEPFERLLQDMRDVHPPSELEDYHNGSIAELEYTLESFRALEEGGLLGTFGLGEAPPTTETPPGLDAALVVECGPGLEAYFEQFGDDFFDSDVFGNSSDDGFSFDETPAPPETGAIGEAVENGGYALTVHSVTDPVVPSDEFFGPDAGSRWVMVEVSITNVSDEPQDYGSYDFKVKDADNFEYTAGFVDLERELSSGSLPPGDTVRGQVGFEVPVDAAIVRLIYDPGFFGESRIDIELE